MLIEATLIGVLIGIVVGALGAGGGILSVPVLVYLLGQNPHQAATLSLIIVGATACVSLITRASSGHVDWKQGSLFAFAGIVGTWGGSALNPLVSARTLMLEFCVLLAFVAIFMVHRQLRARADVSPSPSSIDEAAPGDSPRSLASTLKKAALVVLLASVTGFLTGFFGVGGGFAIVPALHLVLRYPMKKASATSLLIMLITALFGLASRALGGTLDISAEAGMMVACFAAASMCGGILGAKLTRRVSSTALAWAFIVLLIGVASVSAFATLRA
ncbi:sulfite exporter TauE/SafE family protein [uncultured Actinomyces sp.]|uniref:sulfite exporter TauE/SafE family protein n=1 Tax=uncultured Actinomyces sp. TaxID=249061 RepID=UPI0028D165A8|nr:sulfite exporter TauE/SafE family protein [uncultured Actinomyces sp.]